MVRFLGFFRPQEKEEKLIGSEVPYLSVIGALMYLVNYTRLDITFVVNFLAYKKTLVWNKTYTLLS